MTYIISDFSDRLQAADRTFKKSTYDLNQIFKDPTNIYRTMGLTTKKQI